METPDVLRPNSVAHRPQVAACWALVKWSSESLGIVFPNSFKVLLELHGYKVASNMLFTYTMTKNGRRTKRMQCDVAVKFNTGHHANCECIKRTSHTLVLFSHTCNLQFDNRVVIDILVVILKFNDSPSRLFPLIH